MGIKYHVPCLCGKHIEVELFQAGTQVSCPACHNSVAVPGSLKLKELSGDRYPNLSPLNKIAKTAADHETPFDGTCHHCAKSTAEFHAPVRFDVLLERHLDSDGGIRPWAGGLGVKLTVSGGEEQWRSVTFPLLMCTPCSARFDKSRSGASRANTLAMLILGCLAAVVFYFVFRNFNLLDLVLEIFLRYRFMIVICNAILLFVVVGVTRKGGQDQIQWVRKIRWVEEAIALEDEYKLSIGAVVPYEKNLDRNLSAPVATPETL
jgi:hypothetical protein